MKIQLGSLTAILWVAHDAEEKYKHKLSEECMKRLIDLGGFCDKLRDRFEFLSFEATVSDDYNFINLNIESEELSWDTDFGSDNLGKLSSFGVKSNGEDGVIMQFVSPLEWSLEENN